jgi:hypothetical protein
MSHWRPPAGTTTLVEPVDPAPGHETLTATVREDDRLLLDLGASPRPAADIDVVASFFMPDALLRVTGVLVAEADGLFELVVMDIEHVQRRSSDRVDIELLASLLVLDAAGPIQSVLGHTHNVSIGGCRVLTAVRLPPGRDAMVSLHLIDDQKPVVAQATVLDVSQKDTAWDYRLMFTAIDTDDRERIRRMVAA